MTLPLLTNSGRTFHKGLQLPTSVSPSVERMSTQSCSLGAPVKVLAWEASGTVAGMLTGTGYSWL